MQTIGTVTHTHTHGCIYTKKIITTLSITESVMWFAAQKNIENIRTIEDI